MKQNSEKLILAACSGNKQALEQLLIVSQKDIRRFARKTCTTSEDIEDVVQIALWQIHRKIGTLKTIKAYTSWLFRIIERECYRLFRSRLSKNTETESNLENITTHDSDLNLRIDLINAIMTLPPIYRQILIIRDIEEYTAPEAAKKLGITIEAVKSRLHRARTMIKEKLTSQIFLDE
ncbi:MAG: RNA polymerase sigma factor [Snodgrassella sp.]|uniref:RNA polymerase sigma factor n=1 Tax=Snodgrassella TaxID=1193515 RepID=UPI001EF5E256|nr:MULTISPECIES: RNA polymerase sigma factor [Snodgrassella]MCO6520773.1 RNA polymerase sigma factor [Snodgrassella sp.]